MRKSCFFSRMLALKKVSIFFSLLIILLPSFTSFSFSLQAAEKGILRVNSDLGKRVALIIGNSNYSSKVGPLRNPINDARTMAKTLEQAGFEVTRLENIRFREMREAVRKFGSQLRKYDAALFYFSGHGVQYDGKNYLLPIGSEIEIPRHIKYEALSDDEVLGEMEGGTKDRFNIVIVDACRNNLVTRGFRSTQNGLIQPSFQPKGSLIAYATAPGKVASDGRGKNSPYVAELSKHIRTPGLKIEDVLKRVLVGVDERTNGKQTPWYNSSLRGDFYFMPATETSSDASLEYERQKIEEERTRLKLEQQRLNAQKEAEIEYQRKENRRKRLAAEREEAKLREERRRLAAEKRRLAEEKKRVRDDSNKKQKIQSYRKSDTKFRVLYGSVSGDTSFYNTSLYLIWGKWGFGLSRLVLEAIPSGETWKKVKSQNQSLDLTYDYMDDINLTSFLDDTTLTLGLGIITNGEATSSALHTTSQKVSGYRFLGYLSENFGKWELLGGYQYSTFTFEKLSPTNDYSASGGLIVIGFGMEF